MAAHRVYSKLQQAAKTDGKSKVWFDSMLQERKADPLLAYMHHARNVDEHGLQKITEREGAGIAINPANPAEGLYIEHMEISSGPAGMKIQHKGNEIAVHFTPATVRLLPVTDRGIKYPVPASHEGNAAEISEALTASESALAYLKNLVAGAEQRIK